MLFWLISKEWWLETEQPTGMLMLSQVSQPQFVILTSFLQRCMMTLFQTNVSITSTQVSVPIFSHQSVICCGKKSTILLLTWIGTIFIERFTQAPYSIKARSCKKLIELDTLWLTESWKRIKKVWLCLNTLHGSNTSKIHQRLSLETTSLTTWTEKMFARLSMYHPMFKHGKCVRALWFTTSSKKLRFGFIPF